MSVVGVEAVTVPLLPQQLVSTHVLCTHAQSHFNLHNLQTPTERNTLRVVSLSDQVIDASASVGYLYGNVVISSVKVLGLHGKVVGASEKETQFKSK